MEKEMAVKKRVKEAAKCDCVIVRREIEAA